MKKLALLLTFCLSVVGVYAQNSAVSKASQYKDNGELLKAKEQIDLAVAHEKTMAKAKTWFTKAQVYEAIAVAEDPALADMEDSAMEEAISAYNKAKELDKPGGAYDGLASVGLDGLWSNMINKGAEYYNADDYANAMKYFEKSSQLKPDDTTGYFYAGIAAQQSENFDKALTNYYKLIDLDMHSEDIYSSIIYIERIHNKDDEKALEVLTQAREHFPESKPLMQEEINLLIITKKTDAAQEKLKKAIVEQPDNAVLHYNLAYLKEQSGDKEGAVADYQRAIEADPEYFDATFNLAVNYYNNAAEILKSANDMDLRTYQKEGKKVEASAKLEFEKALPYLEKAHQIDGDHQTVLETLQTVYTQLKMTDKAEEANNKLEAMGIAEEEN